MHLFVMIDVVAKEIHGLVSRLFSGNAAAR
jgi:hypothetical protein